jgi:exodeoxyribonuclease V gamma subunit
MSRRLGLRFGFPEEEQEDRETFIPNGLENYLLIGEMVESRIRCETHPEELSHFRKRGFLPPGAAGEALYRGLTETASALASRITGLMGSGVPREVDISVKAGEISVSGTLQGVAGGALILYKPGKLKDTDLVTAWVRHLILSAASPSLAPVRTVYVARDREIAFGPADAPQRLLDGLGELYLRGGKEPLPFFPSTSLEYARRIRKGDPPESALECALAKWAGSERAAGEAIDPYLQRCFGETGPFTSDFAAVAETFFFPLLDGLGTP